MFSCYLGILSYLGISFSDFGFYFNFFCFFFFFFFFFSCN